MENIIKEIIKKTEQLAEKLKTANLNARIKNNWIVINNVTIHIESNYWISADGCNLATGDICLIRCDDESLKIGLYHKNLIAVIKNFILENEKTM